MLRRFVFLAAVLIPMFNLIRAPRADAAQRRVVILDFQNDSEDPVFTWLTTVIPEALRWKLAGIRSLDLIGRRTIDRIVGEQGLRGGDLTGPLAAERVGRLAGAHLVMAGRLIRLGREVQLDYRFVDLPSGFQIQQTRFRTSISTRDALFSALDRVADSLIEALGKRIVMKDGSTAEIESSPLSLSDRERVRLHEPFAKSIETLIRFGDGLAERRRGRLTEAKGRLERAVKPDADFAEAWGWIGIVQMEAGRLKEAAESLTRALSLLRARARGGGEGKGGEEGGEVAAALRRLAQARERQVATRPGSSPRSLRLYRESLEIDRRLGNEVRAARTLGDIARVLEKLNRAGEAVARLKASLAVFRRAGMAAAAAETLGRLAVLHAKEERFDESLRLYRESLVLLRRLDDWRNEIKILNRLADVRVRSGRYPEALKTHRKALRISRDRADSAAEADTLNHLSAAYFRMDLFSKALDAAGRAYAIRSRRRDWAGMADVLNSLGAIHVKLGRPEEALESWCDGRDLARRQGLKKRERRFDRSVKRFIRLHPRLLCPY